MSKKYDIVAVTGTYQKDGETKKRYQNVGAVIQGEHGPYIMLAKWFNPAGLAEEGRESILLSLFEPNGAKSDKPAKETSARQPQPVVDDGFDSIPF